MGGTQPGSGFRPFQGGQINFEGTIQTASYAFTSSYLEGYGEGGTPATASYANFATSASYAITASYALNGGGGGGGSTDTGSLLLTGSVTNATITFTKGDLTTFDLTVDNVQNATSASYVSSIDYQNIANLPSLLSSSQQIASDISGSFTSLSASIAQDIYENSLTSSYAITASYALTTPTDFSNTFLLMGG